MLCYVTSVMSNSVRPHRRQPTRLPRPWDSPGKNTGVGCHFLLQCMKVKGESEVAQSCPTLSDPMDCSLPGSSVHGSFQARVLEWGAIAYCHYKFIYLNGDMVKWLDGITDAMDMSWSKALEMVKDREAWRAVVVGWQRIRHHLVTKML